MCPLLFVGKQRGGEDRSQGVRSQAHVSARLQGTVTVTPNACLKYATRGGRFIPKRGMILVYNTLALVEIAPFGPNHFLNDGGSLT